MRLLLLFLPFYLLATNILVLHSYSPNIKWTTTQSRTINENLLNKLDNPSLYVEFMYTKRFPPSPNRCKLCLDSIKKQYHNIKFDIIITTDDNALNFVRKFKDTSQFRDAKVFFEGVNNLSLYNKLDKNTYAGVFEKKNPLSNLNIALKIKPHLKTIYVISDASNSGNKTINQYKNAFRDIKHINFVYINEKDLDKILNKLKNYDKNSVMMLLTFASIKQKNTYIPPKKVAQIISKYYQNPILVHTDVYVNIPNTNIVGGDCTDAIRQATINTDKVVQYLNNTPLKDIGFTLENANRIYLNVKNLKKFGINAYKLGIDATYVNKPTSFYEIYKTQIISVIIFIVILIVFLIILAKKNKDLHNYSNEIKKLNNSLEIKIKKAIEENRKKDQIMFQQSKFAAMGEMIGAIAHQWRQPLNALAINIQLLLDDYEDKKINEKYLEKFEEEQMKTISFMSKTIDDFRNFFAQDKEKEAFVIKDAIKEVIELFDKQLKNHNITISLKGDDSKILGYKNEFKQVILNIINNAKEAMIENNIENGEIEINVKNNTITIKDNAGGIPKEIQDKIFDPYFTTKENGTGIGLYMAKIIIQEHLKGNINFEVKDNHTIFTINLEERK